MNLEEIITMIRVAEQSRSKSELNYDSMSGESFRKFLLDASERLVSESNAYVEIGVYRGGTLLEVAKNTKGLCVGIDNFSLFNDNNDNEQHIREQIDRFALDNVQLLPLDFERALANFEDLVPEKKIGLLLVDGGHDYRSQLMALMAARRVLADDCLVVIDDANYGHVRQAGYDFVNTHSEWEVSCEILTPNHPNKGGRHLWWNGIQIISRTSSTAEKRKPRDLGFSDDGEISKVLTKLNETHEQFRHKMSPVLTELLYEISELGPSPDLPPSLLKLLSRAEVAGRYESQNVDSANGRIGLQIRPDAHMKRLAI